MARARLVTSTKIVLIPVAAEWLDDTLNIYAVEYTYFDAPEQLNNTRPEHRAFLRSLLDAGSLLASGPLMEQAPGALLIVRAADHESVTTLLASDPFAQAELIAKTTVRRWNPVIGPWDS